MILVCQMCGKYTSELEASLRRFNNGMCGFCNGPLVKENIDLRGKPGDTRFECPICHWGVTLAPAGVAMWTRDGFITPRCSKDNVDLVATVIK